MREGLYIAITDIRDLKWEPESYANGKIEPDSFQAYGLGWVFSIFPIKKEKYKVKENSKFVLNICRYDGSGFESISGFETMEGAKERAEIFWKQEASKAIKDILGDEK